MWLGARGGAAATGLGVVFAALALRQGALLYTGSVPAWEPGTALGEIALALAALGGLVGLRALQRTTLERDRVEDLHWDSMETVRVMSDLAARPGPGLPEKLAAVLELGRRRFGLDAGLAWRSDGSRGEGEILALHAPALDDARQEALVRELAPRLDAAARSTRPTLVQGLPGTASTLFVAGVASGGEIHGALAFAGSASQRPPLTATDKDLLGLMAHWLATELERGSRTAAPTPDVLPAQPVQPPPEETAAVDAAEPPSPAARLAQVARDAFRPRRDMDLNRDVRRVEARLRRRIGADATLTLQLAKDALPVQRGQLSPPRLVESLVEAAVRLCPTGRVMLATEPPAEGSSEAVLRVAVAGPVQRTAVERAFAEPADGEAVPHGTLPLSRLERLLRADGGDLSISIEPGVQAVLTAWLPSGAPRDSKPSRRASGAAIPPPGQSSR